MKNPLHEAGKELGRLLLLTVLSYLLTEGVIAMLVNVIIGDQLSPELKLQITGIVLFLLRAADKWAHELGKKTYNPTLTKGITRF